MDDGVFGAVVGGALTRAAAAERPAPAPTLRERASALCDRSRAVLDHRRQLRAWRADLVASVRARRPVA
jgi:hypothetical protein